MEHFNYIAPLNTTGYGIAAFNIAKGFIEKGFNFTYVPIGTPQLNSLEFTLDPDFNNILKHISNTPNKASKSLCFWHLSNVDQINIPNIKDSVLYTTFELGHLYPKEVENARKFFVTTTALKHTSDIITKYTNSIAGIIPHPLIKDTFTEEDVIPQTCDPIKYWSDYLEYTIPKDTLILSSVGKFEKRKRYFDLIRYGKLFCRPILIIAYWHNPFINGGYDPSEFIAEGYSTLRSLSGHTIYKKNNLLICMMPRVNTRKQILVSIAHTHRFLSASLSEGFNLPLFETLLFTDTPPLVLSPKSMYAPYDIHPNIDANNIVKDYSKLLHSYSAYDGIFFKDTKSYYSNVYSYDIFKAIDFIDLVSSVHIGTNQIYRYKKSKYFKYSSVANEFKSMLLL